MKNIAKNFNKLTNIQQQFKLSKSLVNTQTYNFLVFNKNSNLQGNFNAEIYCLNNICKQNFAKKGKKQEEKQNKKEEKKNLSEQLDKKIDLNVPEQNFKSEIENLSKQLKKIQVGRLTPDFFDRYEIPAYGGKQRFNELAQITPKNETTVILNVYDEGLVNAVYKTLENSGEQFQMKIEGKNIQVVLLGGNTKEAKQNSVKEAEKITLKLKIL
ncbi:Ribosome recycling factor domain [Pseudocohnilembus persalinus]|uniref:Ribosome recycling factor domain n=1 Tax=Pseudocohnilembus persalinus TaxID=266149 RepID=A0A0V0QRM6_PSEPJ|nr:Ribosome recycling factor domain [Pseudocohnilembus persalinus]|eukprot:KRX04918.1 Ribosome recycling factor domain [Pseudocohnilembus persalinus]